MRRGPLTVALTDDFVLAIVGYSVLSGIGAGIVYATCTATVAKWYPEKRAARVGLVTGAIGCGAVPFIATFASILTPTTAPRCSSRWASSCSSWSPRPVRCCKTPGGMVAAGHRPKAVGDRQDTQPQPRQQRHRDPPVLPAEAIRTPAFLVMYLIMVIAAAASLLTAVYVPIVAVYQGFSLTVAALAVGLLAIVNGTGRSIAGRLSDRLGRRRTLTMALLVQGSAQLGLVYSVSTAVPVAFIGFAGLSGLAGGAFYP